MSSSTSIERAILRLANTHDGLVPRQLLERGGISRAAIARRISSGLLVPVLPGVVCVAGTDVTPLRRARAAALIVPGSWVSHTSAAIFWGAEIGPIDLRPEICAEHNRRTRLPAIRSHRVVVPVAPTDRAHSCGVSISRPALCVVELASVLPDNQLELALDSLLHRKKVSTRAIRETLVRRAVAGGPSRFLNQLLDDRDHGFGIVRSWLEQQSGAVLAKAGIRAPVRNYWVNLPSGKRCLDSAWPNVRVAVEDDSWTYHANPGDWGRTRVRDRELQAAGWLIVPCVVADTRSPAMFIEHVRATLDLRRGSGHL